MQVDPLLNNNRGLIGAMIGQTSHQFSRMKSTSWHYPWIFLLIFLVACGKLTIALPNETSIPTVVSPAPTPTSTLISITIVPSLLPTQPIILTIAPDGLQVERWKEYEAALARTILKDVESVLCEWEILGRSDQEIYVWAECISIFPDGNSGLFYHATMPAVIHIGADGAVQSVEIPGIHYADDIRRMFPPDAQEKYFEGLIHFQELTDHLRWRQEHSEVPPLIVLSTTPMP